jgi:hypothetical protein
MATIIFRKAAERRAQKTIHQKVSTMLEDIITTPIREQATRFALEVDAFVRDVMKKECDEEFAKEVVFESFRFFYQQMPPDEMFDGDVRRVVGSFKAWLQTPSPVSTWTRDELEELTDKILETAFLQIYPDHFMYINIVHSYCKNALHVECSGELALQTLDTFFEIFRSFQELGFDAALIRSVAPYKEWLAITIPLSEHHIQSLFTCILQTIHEIYF